MKRTTIFLIFFLSTFFIFYSSHSQVQIVKQWDQRFGGDTTEWFFSLNLIGAGTIIEKTTDSGYVIGGSTLSGISGDVTDSSRGQFDYWLVKTDALGNKQWGKRFGGIGNDLLKALEQTADGGYILGGHIDSGISGDVSQADRGKLDYWMVKTDVNGNKEWDKRFGGDKYEKLYSIHQTSDGGYILGGYTVSDSIGDISQPTKGGEDYWIVKTDSIGAKQWDKRFGGGALDDLFTMQQTSDGGYILGGKTRCDSSGDHHQHKRGLLDYWVVKTDSNGILQWEYRYGGAEDDELYYLLQTFDGGYILGGLSWSGVFGDKSDSCRGGSDFWIVKIDSLGIRQWDKTYGGSLDEKEFGFVKQTSDSGYLISGSTYSNMSGEKSENNMGASQSWVIKTDVNGNKLWDKTILTNGQDETGYAVESSDRCFTVINFTKAGIGGYKTQASRGAEDFWVSHFCDTTGTSSIMEHKDIFWADVFPNPAYSYITLTWNYSLNSETEIIITDAMGKEVFKKHFDIQMPDSGTKIDINSFSNGIYFYPRYYSKRNCGAKVFEDGIR